MSIQKWNRAGIIPVSYVNGRWFFLLGLEHRADQWGSSEKWSDFGGGAESEDTSPLETAVREGYEETMGLLGSKEEIMEALKSSTVHIKGKSYTYFPFFDYTDETADIPSYFTRFYNYILNCAEKRADGKYYIRGCPKGYFEKTEIGWFDEDEINEENDVLHHAVGIIRKFLENRKIYELKLQLGI